MWTFEVPNKDLLTKRHLGFRHPAAPPAVEGGRGVPCVTSGFSEQADAMTYTSDSYTVELCIPFKNMSVGLFLTTSPFSYSSLAALF